MDYRNLLGTAAIILSGAVFVHSLSSANAFPQGPNLSLGSNPVFSFGGTVSNGTSTLFSAPADQIMVVTDLLLSMNSDHCTSDVTLSTSSGSSLAAIDLYSRVINSSHSNNHRAAYNPATLISHTFASGLPIPTNESLEIAENGACNVAYTVSGYYAHP